MVMHKKGALESLGKLIFPLIIVGVVLGFGMMIIAETKSDIKTDQMCVNSSATYDSSTNTCSSGGANNGTSTIANATSDTVEAIGDVPDWLSIIVIIVIGGVLVGLISLFRRR